MGNVIDSSQVSSITKTYGENVYTQSMYMFSINEYLGEETIRIQSLQMYVEGFQLGSKRRNMYESVDQIVSAGLSEYYNQEIVLDIQKANSNLAELTANISNYIVSLDPQAEESKITLLELKEELDGVIAYIYPEYEDKDMSLYTLITSPKPLTEKHSQDEIKEFLLQLNQKVNETLEYITAKSS